MYLRESVGERRIKNQALSATQYRSYLVRRKAGEQLADDDSHSSSLVCASSSMKRNFSAISPLLGAKSEQNVSRNEFQSQSGQDIRFNRETGFGEERRKFARKSPIKKEPAVLPLSIRSNVSDGDSPLFPKNLGIALHERNSKTTTLKNEQSSSLNLTREGFKKPGLTRFSGIIDSLKSYGRKQSESRVFPGTAQNPILVDEDQPFQFKDDYLKPLEAASASRGSSNMSMKRYKDTECSAPSFLGLSTGYPDGLSRISLTSTTTEQDEFRAFIDKRGVPTASCQSRKLSISDNHDDEQTLEEAMFATTPKDSVIISPLYRNDNSAGVSKEAFTTIGDRGSQKKKIIGGAYTESDPIKELPSFLELKPPTSKKTEAQKYCVGYPKNCYQITTSRPPTSEPGPQQQHQTRAPPSQVRRSSPIEIADEGDLDHEVSVETGPDITAIPKMAHTNISPLISSNGVQRSSLPQVLPPGTCDSSVKMQSETQKENNITFISSAEGASLMVKCEPPSRAAAGARKSANSKRQYKTEPIDIEKITGDDLLLLQLDRKGYNNKDIFTRWQDLTGSTRSREYLRMRSKRLRATFPDLFLNENKSSDTIDDIRQRNLSVIQKLREGPRDALILPSEYNDSKADSIEALLGEPEVKLISKHPQQSGKVISEDLKKYILNDLGREEEEFTDEDGDEDDGNTQQSIRTESPEASDDKVHYTYFLVRRVVPKNSLDDDCDWLVCSNTFTSVEEANNAVIAEMGLVRGDNEHSIWPITKWDCELSQDTGLLSYFGSGENGYIQVKVDRLLRNFYDGIVPPSKAWWAKRRVFDVIEIRSGISDQAVEWSEDIQEEVDQAADDSQPKTVIRTITRVKTITKTQHVIERPISSIHTARDRANRHAAEKFLQSVDKGDQFRDEITERLDQMEVDEENFEAEVEKGVGRDEGEIAPNTKTSTLKVKVIERTLENPRNI